MVEADQQKQQHLGSTATTGRRSNSGSNRRGKVGWVLDEHLSTSM
jgi:hypothetical protein